MSSMRRLNFACVTTIRCENAAAQANDDSGCDGAARLLSLRMAPRGGSPQKSISRNVGVYTPKTNPLPCHILFKNLFSFSYASDSYVKLAVSN